MSATPSETSPPTGSLPTEVVDAHLHLWDPARLRYPWLADLPPLRRAFDLAELDRQRAGVPLTQAVFVQCDCVPEDAAGELLLVREAAAADSRLAGAVAFAPLEQGAAVAPWLEDLAREPLVRGVRRLLQSEPDPAFCLRPDFVAGVGALAAHGLVLDLCLLPPQLASATELVRRVGEVTFVLDHLGKPPVRAGGFQPWADELAALAELPNVVAKLSGLATEADPERWREEDVLPYLRHALACFGPERCLFGGDWPVATLATDYPRWFRTVALACADLDDEGRASVFAGNARRVYRLDPS